MNLFSFICLYNRKKKVFKFDLFYSHYRRSLIICFAKLTKFSKYMWEILIAILLELSIFFIPANFIHYIQKLLILTLYAFMSKLFFIMQFWVFAMFAIFLLDFSQFLLHALHLQWIHECHWCKGIIGLTSILELHTNN